VSSAGDFPRALEAKARNSGPFEARTMRITTLSTLAVVAALAALTTTGCDTTEPAYSTIRGTIDQGTFPSPVQQITVASDRDVVSYAPVDRATGAFEIQLVWGSTYVFLLAPGGQGTPLIVSTGGHGELEVEVGIVTGGASADIGAVRYWGGDASDTTTTTSPQGSCSEGLIQGTTQPCSSGPAVLACDGIAVTSPGPQGGDAWSHDHGRALPHAIHAHHGDDDDGTDEGGGDGVLLASPSEPMAVPTLSLPVVLGCADDLSD
jgi:hypothetical protein